MQSGRPHQPGPDGGQTKGLAAALLMVACTYGGLYVGSRLGGPMAMYWGAICGLALACAASYVLGLARPIRSPEASARWAVVYASRLGAAVLALGSVVLGGALGGPRGAQVGLVVGLVLVGLSLALWLAFRRRWESALLARRRRPR